MDLDNQMKLVWAGLSTKGYSAVFQSVDNPKFSLVLSFSGFVPSESSDEGIGMLKAAGLGYEIRNFGTTVRPYWEPNGFGKAFTRLLVSMARTAWPSFKDLTFDFGPQMGVVLGKDGYINYY